MTSSSALMNNETRNGKEDNELFGGGEKELLDCGDKMSSLANKELLSSEEGDEILGSGKEGVDDVGGDGEEELLGSDEDEEILGGRDRPTVRCRQRQAFRRAQKLGKT